MGQRLAVEWGSATPTTWLRAPLFGALDAADARGVAMAVEWAPDAALVAAEDAAWVAGPDVEWGGAAAETSIKQQRTSKMAGKRRIAIAADDTKGLDGEVSLHFGRCPAYVVVDVDGDDLVETKVVENPYLMNHQPGLVPHFLAQLGADVILAGGMGPRAIGMFQDFGIEVATGIGGNAGRVLQAYLAGRIQGIVPCNHDHDHEHGEGCGEHGHGHGHEHEN